VIYLGTFSKVLFPALRLGYVVVPFDLVNAFVRMQMFSSLQVPLLEQIALTSFLREGYFIRHIRRMGQLYHQRQGQLLNSIKQTLAGSLDIQPDQAGMHLIGWLVHNRDDRQIAYAAARVEVDVSPLSRYCLQTHQHPAILLGYTAVDEEEMETAVKKLAHVLI